MASVPSSPTSPLSPLPTQTYHTSILPRSIPTAACLTQPWVARTIRASSPSTSAGVLGMPSEPNPFHLTVLDDIKDMYEGFATKEMLQKRWRKDAEYEDPYTRCKGLNEIAPQWYALPRMYTKLTLTGRRVLSSTEHPNRLILWQKHEYTIRVTGSKKVVESILVIDFDEEGKIARMVDQRRGQDPPTSGGAAATQVKRPGRSMGSLVEQSPKIPAELSLV
ncbi:hypothetical protein BJV77DRAFT_108300 [Russula vinacea]|nr:hypothetical protein BJV77DRAFT_108300 [Russula vinacea]